MTFDPNALDNAIILYGRASFDARQRLAALAERLGDRFLATIATAYADLSGPSLPETLERLADKRIASVLVVPCMTPTDPSLTVWLPGALSAWRSARAVAPSVRLAPPIEAFFDIADLATRAIMSSAALMQDVAESAPSMGKPGWSFIPEHRRQVFFCTGARCLHRGAEPLYQRLRAAIKADRELSKGPKRVLCARTSCQFPCNLGPMLTVHPDGVWYGRLDDRAVDRIAVEHLGHGRIVADLCLRRTLDNDDPPS